MHKKQLKYVPLYGEAFGLVLRSFALPKSEFDFGGSVNFYPK